MLNWQVAEVDPPPSQRSTTCWDKNIFLMPSFLYLFPAVYFLMWKHSLSKTHSKTQNIHWLNIDFKYLLVPHNQQGGNNCEIYILVPNTSLSRLNHRLYWMVTVLLWCRNLKPKDYEGRSTLFTALNKLSGRNQYFCACLLTFYILIVKYA